MPQYMLSVHHDGSDFDKDIGGYADDAEMQEAFAATEAFNQKVMDAGKWVFGGGLQMPDTATTVRLQDGDTVLTDGPYSETKEFLGGFWVLELADLDEALALGREAAVACKGDVEVRPFQGEITSE
jgi:hypothetical protein